MELRFDPKIVLPKLKALEPLIRESQEVSRKSVYLAPWEKGFYLRINTGDVQASIPVEAEGTLKPCFLDFKALGSVLKGAGDTAVLYEQKQGLRSRVYGGVVELERFNLDASNFEHEAYAQEPGNPNVDSPRFHAFVRLACESMSFAEQARLKRVRVDKRIGYANFLSSVAIFQDTGVKEGAFRVQDLTLFRGAFCPDAPASLREVRNEYILQQDGSTFIWPKVDTEDIMYVQSMAANFPKGHEVRIDSARIHGIAALIRGMAGDYATVSLIQDQGELVVRASSRTSRAMEFPLASIPEGPSVRVSCSASLLCNAASLAARRGDTLPLYIVDGQNVLIFGMGDVEIVFGGIIT